MGSETSAKRDIDFAISESVQAFHISREEWLSQNPQYSCLAIGSLLYHDDRLLIVQRAADERAFPNIWEYPGGGCEGSAIDMTLLHGVVRELYEEAGLRATRIVRQVGGIHSWTSRSGRAWAKLSFEVEVERNEGVTMGEEERRGTSQSPASERAVPVKLDPREHQRYLWVTEEDIRANEVGGERIPFMNEANRDIALAGFVTRKTDRTGHQKEV